MKTQQLTAILLCALVGSTLGHDFLRAKRFAPEPRTSIIASPIEDCVSEVNNDLQLIVDNQNQTVGLVNEAAKAAIIIEPDTNLVGIFDGSNGAVSILNLEAKIGKYIAGGLTQISWMSVKLTFADFFKGLRSLQDIADLKIGEQFTFSSISRKTLSILTKLVISFSADIGVQSQTDPSAALMNLVEICLPIMTSLKNMEGVFGSTGGLIELPGDLIMLSGVLGGLDSMISQVGLPAVVAANITLDLNTLLSGENNDLELFINILFAFAAKGKLSLLAGLLSSNKKIIGLIVELGGNNSTGVTGLFNVIFNTYLLHRNEIKIVVFLGVLVEYCASRTSGESLNLDVIIQDLSKVVESLEGSSSSGELAVFVKFVENLKTDSLVLDKLNISKIITILLQTGATNGLKMVVEVLVAIAVLPGLGIAVTVTALLTILLLLLNTSVGIGVLNRLGIKIDISAGKLTQGLDVSAISKILSLPRGLNLKKLLKEFPAFGTIFNSLSAELKSVSNGSYILPTIVNSSTGLLDTIVGLVKGLLGLGPALQPVITIGGGGIGGILGGIGGILGGVLGGIGI